MNKRIVIFLDIDDVICLNTQYGGYDAKKWISNEFFLAKESEFLWEKLFDQSAINNLVEVHQKWNPCYVISSSWRTIFDKSEIQVVLERSGLGCVARSLHKDWSTPIDAGKGLRSAEIGIWLSKHPELQDSWVVVDDNLSGRDLLRSFLNLNFVVLCQEGVGLQKSEAEKLEKALNDRAKKFMDK